jgi:hypothetical protein
MRAVQKEEVFIFILIYLTSSLILSRIGNKRNIGWLKTFLISIFFTPVAGFFAVIFSRTKKFKGKKKARIYRCSNCKYEFRHSFDVCPFCGTEYKKKVKEGVITEELDTSNQNG